MEPPQLFATVLGYVLALLGVLGAALVNSKASPYSAIAARVLDLEKRITALEAERDELRAGKADVERRHAIVVEERDELRRQLEQERRENRAYIVAIVEAARGTSFRLPAFPKWFDRDPITEQADELDELDGDN